MSHAWGDPLTPPSSRPRCSDHERPTGAPPPRESTLWHIFTLPQALIPTLPHAPPTPGPAPSPPSSSATLAHRARHSAAFIARVPSETHPDAAQTPSTDERARAKGPVMTATHGVITHASISAPWLDQGYRDNPERA